MRIYRVGIGLLFATVLSVSAQVTVEVRLDQEQYLSGESLPVTVRVTNRSGQTLHLGAEPDWLSFSIDSRQGGMVPKTGEVQVIGEFDLPSSKVAVKQVDLAPYFPTIPPGRYDVAATVRIRDWNRDLVSPAATFDVVTGTKLWEQEVGIPRAGDSSSAPPEVRRYILQEANYTRGRLRLSLQVTDNYGKIFRVAPIGNLLSFSHPTPQIDRFSNLHVLYQSGPNSYSYTAFNPVGEMIARQTYDVLETRPRLRMADDGIISVAGGIRHVTPNDIPPPPEEPETESSNPQTRPSSPPDPAKELSSGKP